MMRNENMSNFDLEKELTELEYPEMFKAGLKYYIQTKNSKIKSKKEFEKIIKEYSELSVGG